VDNAQYDRGVKVKMQLDQMVDTLNSIDVSMSLIWLWAWDLIRDKYQSHEFITEGSEYVVTAGTTLDTIWEKLWANPPSDFTLEYGAEQMDEAVMDWMIDNNFLAVLEDDDWLDESSDVESDDVQLNME
jgi:hypothetical protein